MILTKLYLKVKNSGSKWDKFVGKLRENWEVVSVVRGEEYVTVEVCRSVGDSRKLDDVIHQSGYRPVRVDIPVSYYNY